VVLKEQRPGAAIEAELNPEQAEAASHVAGPLLVFAGAGSGKTRVITYRIANLVAIHRVPPWRILAVTFTNKAAREMQERLVGLLGEDVARDLWVGTFHATCARLLRRHGDAVGLSRSFTIYDSTDQKAVIKRVMRDLGIDEQRYKASAVLHAILENKQVGVEPERMERRSYVDDVIQKIYVEYNKYLRAANAVDFEDLLGLVVKILEDESSPASKDIRERFSHVLVDEFQDTNRMQYRLVRALVKGHENVCVVGDDDQSIYRWRGADVRNIRGFMNDFPQAHVVKLERNYRSTKSIVAAALGIIQRSSDRVPKKLWTHNHQGDPVTIVETANERDEAAFVVRTIAEAERAGVSPGSIAVFYRIHAQSRVMEEVLRSVGMHYQIVGGTKFYERAEIKDAIAYLRVLSNPKSDVDLFRIINSPARGIGKTTIERLADFASKHGLSAWDALERVAEVEGLPSAAKKKLEAFRGLMRRLSGHVPHATPREILDEVLSETGYVSSLAEEKSAEADARIENLRELSSSLDDYAKEALAGGQEPTLAGYLERVSLVSDNDDPHGQGRVTLMTVHAAKGLEFDLVILTGMEDDMFPYRSAEQRDRGATKEDIDEERRLAYVAITRARERLVITHATSRHIFGGIRGAGPSRFLADIPRSVVREMRTAAAAAAPGRFIDRVLEGRPTYGEPARSFARPRVRRKWERAPVSAMPGETWVDRSCFEDETPSFESLDVRKGTPVSHAEFGDGEVVSVSTSTSGEPAVIAFFPGWGQRKVLARYLKFG
jgi:DNA helicase-2/ATP-dependent DNA helicase PcrA